MTAFAKYGRMKQWSKSRGVMGRALLLIAVGTLLGCSGLSRTCVTAYGACEVSQPGKAGYTCVCKYQFHANPGVYDGGR